MDQVINHWPLTAEVRVHAQVNPCGSYGVQIDNPTGFSPSSSVFLPVSFHRGSPYSYIYHLRVNKRPVSGRSSQT
jgi:hypothetical protein